MKVEHQVTDAPMEIDISSVIEARCPWTNGALPTVDNGYRSSVANLRAFSDGFATGYYDIACDLGYTLDPEIGSRISCLETGQWSSPLPKCVCKFLQSGLQRVEVEKQMYRF